MSNSQFAVGRLALFLTTLFLVCSVAKGQTVTSKTVSLGPNVGTFSYNVTSNVVDCSDVYTNTQYSFDTMVYTSVDGVQHSLGSDSTYYTKGAPSAPPTNLCSHSTQGPTITFSDSTVGYSLVIVPHAGSLTVTIGVPGYVNPKYVVVGVTYAPPGSQSNVNYSNSSLISNTSSLNSSFSSTYTVTVTVATSGGLHGWANGSTTTTSTSWGQETDTASSVTVSKETQIALQVPGPASPYSGVDHDYDIIWVWLNPVALFTLTNNGVVQWNGYGYSTLDQPAMDIIGVYAGCLNGVFSQSYCNSQYQTPFARNWASVETWPSGQGPGLTTVDLQNILAADPYGTCTATAIIGASACPNPDSTRFTLTLNTDIPYQQPPPGGQPFTTQYQESYQTATSTETSYKRTFSQMFGREKSFSGKIFSIGFDLTLSVSQTFEWTHQAGTKFETASTSTAAASITGPPCSVANNACNPAYPPNPLNYGTAIQFDLYQDNLFGGFLFIPVQY